jgi:hypothetical protein
MTTAAICQAQLREVERTNNIYKDNYKTWQEELSKAEENVITTLSAYDAAEKYLLETPIQYFQQVDGCWVDSRADCNNKCANERSLFTLKNRKKITASGHYRHTGCWGNSHWDNGRCTCDQPDPTEHQTRYQSAQIAKSAWETAIARRDSLLQPSARPKTPQLTAQCCVNSISCPENASCDGSIQICRNIIELKFKEEDAAEKLALENVYLEDIKAFLSVIPLINTNINVYLAEFNKQIGRINKIINGPKKNINRDVDLITKIYNDSSVIYTNLGRYVSDFIIFNEDAKYFNSNTRNDSPIKRQINNNTNNINSSLEPVRQIYAQATQNWAIVREVYQILVQDVKNLDKLKEILKENELIINYIGNHINIMNDSYNNFLNKISTNEESLKNMSIIIEELKLEDQGLLSYMKKFNENNEKIRKNILSYGPESIVLDIVTKLNDEYENVKKEINVEYNKVKNFYEESKKIYDNLKKDFDNYKLLLDIKSKIDSINNDIYFNKINSLLEQAKTLDVVNNEDVLTLDNIKEEASNIINDPKISDNFTSFNKLKESADKIISNYDMKTPFKNLLNEFVDYINNIIEVNNQNFKNAVKKIQPLTYVADLKKDKFESNEIILKEKNINSDELLLEKIKEDELKNLLKEDELKNSKVKEQPPDNTLYIIIGVVVLIIIIIFIIKINSK